MELSDINVDRQQPSNTKFDEQFENLIAHPDIQIDRENNSLENSMNNSVNNEKFYDFNNQNVDNFQQEENNDNMSEGGYSMELNSAEIRRKKGLFLRSIERFKKKGYPPHREFTMNDTYEDLKIEYETLKKEVYLESSLKDYKQWTTLAVNGIEWLNKKVDPIGADLDGWGTHFALEVNNGDFDETFEELYDKYYDKTIDLPPELKMLKHIGQSAFMFNASKSVFSNFSFNHENIDNNTKKDIMNMLDRKGYFNDQKRQANEQFSRMPGIPKFDVSQTQLSDHSIGKPSIPDDIMNEIDMDINMNNPVDNESKLTVDDDGKKTLIL